MQNYSLYAIPAYYILTLIPNVMAVVTIKQASKGRFDNANPRSSKFAASLEKTVPPAVLESFERRKACHQNGLESLPLFCTALVLANMARAPTSSLNTFAGVFMSLRVVYTMLYLNTTDGSIARARSAVWMVGTIYCLYTIYQAAGIFRLAL